MEMHRALSNSLSIKTNVEVITGNKNNLWKSSDMSENVTFSAVVTKKITAPLSSSPIPNTQKYMMEYTKNS